MKPGKSDPACLKKLGSIGSVFFLFVFCLSWSPVAIKAEIPQTNTTVWEAQAELPDEGDMLFELSFPLIVSVVAYTGQQRQVTPAKKQFFSYLEQAVPDIKPFLDLYAQEILVSEGTERLWLPIQQQVLDRLKDEVGSHGTIILFVRFAGLAAGEEPVFFVIDYIDQDELPPGVHETTNDFI